MYRVVQRVSASGKAVLNCSRSLVSRRAVALRARPAISVEEGERLLGSLPPTSFCSFFTSLTAREYAHQVPPSSSAYTLIHPSSPRLPRPFPLRPSADGRPFTSLRFATWWKVSLCSLSEILSHCSSRDRRFRVERYSQMSPFARQRDREEERKDGSEATRVDGAREL
jgi:hypothetical protein